MSAPGESGVAAVDGFEIALHRALTEPILLGGAPRSVATSPISNTRNSPSR